jgi:O-antigen/teichoic acid export membrane protein
MDIYTRFAKGVGLITITNVLVSVSGIILLPILTKNLPTGDYGAYVQVTVTATLLAFPLTLGLPLALVRFIALLKERQNLQEDFYSILLIVALVNLLVSGILFLLSKPLAEYLFNGNLVVAELLPIITFFTSLNVCLLDFFRAFQQINRYTFLTFAQTYVGVALISYFVLSGQGVSGAVLGLLIAQLALFSVMLFVIVRRIGFKIPQMGHLRRYLSFSVPLVPSNLSFWVVNSSDRYLIGILLGASFVAYYGPSYTLGMLIAMLATPFSLMLAASLPKHYDGVDTAIVQNVFKYTLKYFLAAAIPSFFILSILSKPLLLALSTPEIASNGYLVTPFVAAAAVLWGTQQIFVQIVILEKKTKIVGILWVISALMNLGLNIFLIPLVGIFGAAISTLVSFLFIFFTTIIYSRSYAKFDLNLRFICKSGVASLLMVLVIRSLDLGSKFSIFIAASAGVAAYIVLILLMKGFEKDELMFFVRLFQNMRA